MPPRLAFRYTLGIAAAAGLLAGCGGSASVPQTAQGVRPVSQSRLTQSAPSLPSRALIAANFNSGNLEYWPFNKRGGTSPTPLVKGLGLKQPIAMVANKNDLIVTDDSQILLYDLATMKSATLPDRYGTPIDVAIGKDGSIYASNLTRTTMNVAVYAPGQSNPKVLYCASLQEGSYIAVDNESDIFISGYSSSSGLGIYEFAHDSSQCAQVNLRPVLGYGAGIAVDPKNDALLVLDDPGVCAGPGEGRLTTYPKPYRAATGIERVLGGTCPMGGLRLNGDSTAVFYGDAGNEGGGTIVREASYPFGKAHATYAGGHPLGFTTIPNSLPN